jgi:hypothetical protein
MLTQLKFTISHHQPCQIDIETNYRERHIACSSVDAVSASISMAYSDKDAPASRKLVGIGLSAQFAGFIVEGVTLGRLTRFGSKVPVAHPGYGTPHSITSQKISCGSIWLCAYFCYRY